jgi:hypothetical protein
LPSYENVCIAFLENLLNDAPVFMNQGPNPQQIEDIILAFLDQLLRDARAYDPGHVDSQTATSGEEPPPVFRPAKLTRPKTKSIEIQKNVDKQDTYTQSFRSISSIQTPQRTVSILPATPRPRPLGISPSPSQNLHLLPERRSFSVKSESFVFPPSLKKDRAISQMIRDAGIVNVPPKRRKLAEQSTNTQTNILHMQVTDAREVFTPEPLPEKVTAIDEPESESPPPFQESSEEIPERRERKKIVKERVPRKPVEFPELLELRVAPLDDLKDLKMFNIGDMMRDLESSSEEEVSSVVESDTSFSSSRISAELGSDMSSDDDIGKGLSQGEVLDFHVEGLGSTSMDESSDM